MLACPNCTARLSRVLTAKGVLYVCSQCGGRAAAISVLRKQADPSFMKTLRLAAYDSRPRQGRRCPHCARPMAEVCPLPGQAPLMLDVCTQCHVVWFDPKEFAQVPPPPAAAGLGPQLLSPAAAEAALPSQPAKQGRLPRDDYLGPERLWKYLPAIFGMPVEMEADRLARKPVLTWGLSAVMALLFLYLLSQGVLQPALSEWGFIPGQWARRAGLTLLSSFLLHAGPLHLLSNLYFFVIFGDNVEDHLGRGRFILLLLGSHLAGMALHAGLTPRPEVPCVGASAGIAGVIAYYAVAFPHARIGFLFWFRWFALPAFVAFLLFLALQLLGSWRQVAGFGSVSYLGHLGGLAIGIMVGLIARLRSANVPR